MKSDYLIASIENIREDENLLLYFSHKYYYNKSPVPRVTEILSSMLHEDYLMTWSNNIGLYQKKKYKDVLNIAANKGSYVHSFIEDFIMNNKEPDVDKVPCDMRDEVKNAFDSFLLWWEIITKNNKVEIIYSEHTLTCPYYGGTLDLLIKINDRIFLIDFKTSNYPSYKYFLQLSAYRYCLYNYENININGCLILMLDKRSISFDELVLDFNIEEHYQFISYCEQSFLSILYAYYNRLKVEYHYGLIFNK